MAKEYVKQADKVMYKEKKKQDDKTDVKHLLAKILHLLYPRRDICD